MLSIDQLTDIIARGKRLDVVLNSDLRDLPYYGLTDEEIAVVMEKL